MSFVPVTNMVGEKATRLRRSRLSVDEPAFEVDVARSDEVEAILRRDRPVIGPDLLAELRAHFVDDRIAEVEGVTDRFPVRIAGTRTESSSGDSRCRIAPVS